MKLKEWLFSEFDFKLRKHYRRIVISSAIIPIFLLWLVWALPNYFSWMGNTSLVIWSLIGIICYQAIVVPLHLIFKYNIFYILIAISWPIFYFLIILATGGIHSTLIFILVIPLLTSTITLQQKETRLIGVVMTIILALFIFIEPQNLSDPAIVGQHFMQVFLYALIAFYFYQMVSDALHYKVSHLEAKQKLADMLELNNIKDIFLTTVSHQLRTPLSIVRWNLSELKDSSELSLNNQDILKVAQDHLDKSLVIIEELLKSAEIDIKKYELANKKSLICINDLIEELILETRSLAHQNKNIVNISLSKNKLYTRGNYQLLFGALFNLFDNAFRYTKNGKVDILLKESDKNIVLMVIDTGVGISEEDKKHIFDQVYRGQNVLTIDPNRSGVGLAVSKKILELHDAKIKLLSELDKGTTVIVELIKVENKID
ncbi:MAG: HAMP domain-containing sensor histidine kinase [Candidatus Pacebacteria bacterium]|nr:HAMP domain-containing sensor histidine kinase [Candidatus Paceibacterota bacterium]